MTMLTPRKAIMSVMTTRWIGSRELREKILSRGSGSLEERRYYGPRRIGEALRALCKKGSIKQREAPYKPGHAKKEWRTAFGGNSDLSGLEQKVEALQRENERLRRALVIAERFIKTRIDLLRKRPESEARRCADQIRMSERALLSIAEKVKPE